MEIGFGFIMRPISGVLAWLARLLDEGGWVRRGVLGISIYATWKAMLWSMSYAEAHADRPGVDVAAVVAAVTAVPGGIASFAFKWYLESRCSAATEQQ